MNGNWENMNSANRLFRLKGYENLYKITKCGKFWNIKKQRWTNIYISSSGYLSTTINWKVRNIHRLLAINFIPNKHNKREVNHKNGIKTDNRLENLEWVTTSENMKHTYANNFTVITRERINRQRKTYRRNCKLGLIKPYMLGRTNFTITESNKIVEKYRDCLYKINNTIYNQVNKFLNKKINLKQTVVELKVSRTSIYRIARTIKFNNFNFYREHSKLNPKIFSRRHNINYDTLLRILNYRDAYNSNNDKNREEHNVN